MCIRDRVSTQSTGTTTENMGKGARRNKDAMKHQLSMEMYSGACEAPAEVPGGWNFIYAARKFKVMQSINFLEAVSQGCCECSNFYDVLSKFDDHEYRKVYRVREESSCCSRCCCAPNHNFALIMTDHADQEVLGMYLSLIHI
eukprot:TRINITY_DN20522_c0_g1_i3.p1 TRINITY_DN20522_c0_g1~~TRINITY_DN20522_c0_g1_i3.p1  ORF type:complete len:143 (-),score=35.89 TRINITY_DN20522_c0_g1_i3:151-579(-)